MSKVHSIKSKYILFSSIHDVVIRSDQNTVRIKYKTKENQPQLEKIFFTGLDHKYFRNMDCTVSITKRCGYVPIKSHYVKS